MTEAVIFDMDGVLTDSEPVINAAAIAGLHEFGVEASPEDFIPFVGAGEDRYIGGVAELHGKTYVPDMKTRVYEIYLRILPDRIKTFPGVHELLAALRRAGVPVGVASSADRIKVEANLKGIGLRLETFAAIVAGEDVEHKKPDPAIYLAAATKMGLPPGRCCVLEDAIHGIEAAKVAGMRCVAVEHSFGANELRPARPDVIRTFIAEVTFEDLGLPPAPPVGQEADQRSTDGGTDSGVNPAAVSTFGPSFSPPEDSSSRK